ALDPQPGGRLVDGTLGGGGHAEAILERTAPDGRLLGLDQDPEAVEAASRRLGRFGDRAVILNRNFPALQAAAAEPGFAPGDGVPLDLGVSSHQLTSPSRGFSLREDAPLDMRMDPAMPASAADVLADLPERELADLIYAYGEEPRSRAIARAIVRERERAPIT